MSSAVKQRHIGLIKLLLGKRWKPKARGQYCRSLPHLTAHRVKRIAQQPMNITLEAVHLCDDMSHIIFFVHGHGGSHCCFDDVKIFFS